jgi:hypothetical protein
MLFGAFGFVALASHSAPLVVVTGAALAAFGVALIADYRGLATGLRQAQWRLDVSAESYRLIGGVATVIGLIWMALALART